MTGRSTRSNTDLSQTPLESLALRQQQKQNKKLSMELEDMIKTNKGESQDVTYKQRSSNMIEEIDGVCGHELYDQHHDRLTTKPTPLQASIRSIEKFNGEGDAENWLEQIITTFDSLQLSTAERHNVIPEILTGDAIIWYGQHQQKMPTFVTFMRHFLHEYVTTPNHQTGFNSGNVSSTTVQPVEIADCTTAVVTSLRNQMLLNSLEKLPKFSGRGTQNVSRWLREIEQSMHLLKLSDQEKFFFISSCLESDARDWYFDNVQLISTWKAFVPKFIKTFESSGKADISFNRLRHYEQGLNQDVRQYYFEIMKLCKETNPWMDKLTKLQYLKDGLKPSLRFDILLKNPETPEDFLEYAQRIEELKSLDNKQEGVSSFTSVVSATHSNNVAFNQSLTSPVRNNSTSFHLSTPPRTQNSYRSSSNYANCPDQINSHMPPSTYQCYRCGGTDHFIRDCPQSRDSYNSQVPPPTYQCYRCGGADHFIRNCPHFQ